MESPQDTVDDLLPANQKLEGIPGAIAVASRRRMALPSRGSITSRFGPRWGEFHHGLDLRAPIGSPVRAALSGAVTFAGWRSDIYGFMIAIDHGGGLVTRYAHNSKILVKPGQKVRQGQIIARSGETGRVTGPHVHFEVIEKGRLVNPLLYTR